MIKPRQVHLGATPLLPRSYTPTHVSIKYGYSGSVLILADGGTGWRKLQWGLSGWKDGEELGYVRTCTEYFVRSILKPPWTTRNIEILQKETASKRTSCLVLHLAKFIKTLFYDHSLRGRLCLCLCPTAVIPNRIGTYLRTWRLWYR